MDTSRHIPSLCSAKRQALYDVTPEIVLSRIEMIALSCAMDVVKGDMNGGFHMIRRKAKNVTRDNNTRAIGLGNQTQLIRFSARSATNVARLMQVMATVHHLLVTGRRVSQREMYYMLIHLFKSQIRLNDTVLDLSAMLAVPRYALNIGAATRGVLAGCVRLAFFGSPYRVDCEYVGIVSNLVDAFSNENVVKLPCSERIILIAQSLK